MSDLITTEAKTPTISKRLNTAFKALAIDPDAATIMKLLHIAVTDESGMVRTQAQTRGSGYALFEQIQAILLAAKTELKTTLAPEKALKTLHTDCQAIQSRLDQQNILQQEIEEQLTQHQEHYQSQDGALTLAIAQGDLGQIEPLMKATDKIQQGLRILEAKQQAMQHSISLLTLEALLLERLFEQVKQQIFIADHQALQEQLLQKGELVELMEQWKTTLAKHYIPESLHDTLLRQWQVSLTENGQAKREQYESELLSRLLAA